MTQRTPRKVAIFTGNRAEYGLYYPIIRAIARDDRLDYFLLVSGAHLKEDFGSSLGEIKSDGFRVHTEVSIEVPGDNLSATAHAIGSCILGLSKVLREISPDLVVVYADRFEAFAALITATQMGIPTAHIEGGDYTEGGALDDSVRHAMTKLAHLHFTTNQQAFDRILRMGEEPWRVFNVGMPALDLVAEKKFATPEDVYQRLVLDSNRPILVFTQHSVATEFEHAEGQVRASLEALEEVGRKHDCQIIISYPNDDAGGRRIIHLLEEFRQKGHAFIQVHKSLGRYVYHGLLNVATACVGNSSSGIKETPAFRCACVDVGSRQQGRLSGDNVIRTRYDRAEIVAAIERCLFDEDWRKRVKECYNPYGAGNAGPRITEILATMPLDLKLLQKKMTY